MFFNFTSCLQFFFVFKNLWVLTFIVFVLIFVLNILESKIYILHLNNTTSKDLPLRPLATYPFGGYAPIHSCFVFFSQTVHHGHTHKGFDFQTN